MEEHKKSLSEIRKEETPGDQQSNIQAHKQAESDIGKDPELSAHSPNDDLDEGELARLGGDENPLG